MVRGPWLRLWQRVWWWAAISWCAIAGCHVGVPCCVPLLGDMLGCHSWVPFMGAMAGCYCWKHNNWLMLWGLCRIFFWILPTCTCIASSMNWRGICRTIWAHHKIIGIYGIPVHLRPPDLFVPGRLCRDDWPCAARRPQQTYVYMIMEMPGTHWVPFEPIAMPGCIKQKVEQGHRGKWFGMVVKIHIANHFRDTYIHPFIHACIQTYIDTNIRKYIVLHYITLHYIRFIFRICCSKCIDRCVTKPVMYFVLRCLALTSAMLQSEWELTHKGHCLVDERHNHP